MPSKTEEEEYLLKIIPDINTKYEIVIKTLSFISIFLNMWNINNTEPIKNNVKNKGIVPNTGPKFCFHSPLKKGCLFSATVTATLFVLSGFKR